MSGTEWLPLAEYSSKYKVSISTLRRRIKGEDVEYSFSEGKYLLRDKPLNEHNKRVINAPPPQQVDQPEPAQPMNFVEESEHSSAFAAANQLLSEIKRAYSIILQEKEEQIIHLKDEVADLKTLVRVLEEDNMRLKSTTPREPIEAFDGWLKSLDK